LHRRRDVSAGFRGVSHESQPEFLARAIEVGSFLPAIIGSDAERGLHLAALGD
jgi:hypothetical protein